MTDPAIDSRRATEPCARGRRIPDDGLLLALDDHARGIGLNAVLGWWWADPVAALGTTWFIGKEGAEAWRGEGTCCD